MQSVPISSPGVTAEHSVPPSKFEELNEPMPRSGSLSALQEVINVGLLWADLDPTPRMIVDLGLKIVWQNRPAAALLAQQTDLIQRQGTLVATAADHDDMLRDAIGAAAAELSHLVLPCSDGSHILFRLRRLSKEGDRPLAGLIFYSCATSVDPQFADLRAAFSLTNGEQEVMLMLHRGLTAEKIASALRLSIETIRSHIRSAYQKLGVSSREEMFRKLHPYRLA
jgi:DNA-binding CsgD family transcriptional regulator